MALSHPYPLCSTSPALTPTPPPPDKNYADAIDNYTRAIDLNPNMAPYYGNRAFAYLRTECFGYALADADAALNLDSTYTKAYYRRATANMSLGKFKVALKDFEAVRQNSKTRRIGDECFDFINHFILLQDLYRFWS